MYIVQLYVLLSANSTWKMNFYVHVRSVRIRTFHTKNLEILGIVGEQTRVGAEWEKGSFERQKRLSAR